jgi:glycosyltransferase involved in cell wall biosynthesis
MEPLISVKIPTYNCAKYLKQTIESILNQKDFDLGLLEIEVIDDYSTLDDPEQVVEKYGDGKVKFFRQLQNVGSVNNFNTCINRSKASWIHILHGDDVINPFFYSKYLKLIKNYEVDFISSLVNYISSDSTLIKKQNIFDSRFLMPFTTNSLVQGNIFLTPSVLVKKNVYDKIGLFKPELNHTADWEMWARILYSNKGIVLNEYLSSWRDFEDSDTKKVRKNGQEVRDHFNALVEISNIYKLNKINFDQPTNVAVINCLLFISKKDFKSFWFNYKEFFKFAPFYKKIAYSIFFVTRISFKILL